MPIVRFLFLILGFISLILGVIGVFLPLLPTTPFLLLSAYLFFRSSPRAYQWLMQQPYLGKYIHDYREYKVIPKRAKIISITVMWTSIVFCSLFVIPHWWIGLLLILISAAVTYHILSFNSKIDETGINK